MSETTGNMTVSPVSSPGDHAACDAEMTRLRERAERAEAKLAAITELPPLYIGTVAEGNAVVSRPDILAIIGPEQTQERSDEKEARDGEH